MEYILLMLLFNIYFQILAIRPEQVSLAVYFSVGYQAKRHASQSSGTLTNFKPLVKLNESLVLYETQSQLFEKDERPLAVVFSWLNAKESNVAKYRAVYDSHGMDMLHVRTTAANVVFDRKLMDTVHSVLDFIMAPEAKRRPFLMHGFSVGAYLYCHSAVEIMSNPDKYADVQRRLKGIVMDSPVDFDFAARGLSRTITSVRWLQNALEKFFSFQFRYPLNFTMRRFHEMSKVFRENPLRLPALVFNSHRDEIASHERVNEAIATWRSYNVPVTDHWWSDSLHAAHYRKHPEEYAAFVRAFCRQIGIIPVSEMTSIYEQESIAVCNDIAREEDNEERIPVREKVSLRIRAK